MKAQTRDLPQSRRWRRLGLTSAAPLVPTVLLQASRRRGRRWSARVGSFPAASFRRYHGSLAATLPVLSVPLTLPTAGSVTSKSLVPDAVQRRNSFLLRDLRSLRPELLPKKPTTERSLAAREATGKKRPLRALLRSWGVSSLWL